MNRTIAIVAFIGSILVLALGLLFLCAASVVPGRLPLAIVLLVIGAVGAGASALFYWRWTNLRPGALAVRITQLAAENNGEVTLAQAMSALGISETAATPAFQALIDKGQCQRERRGEEVLYIFPGLKEHKVVRRCVYCGSTFPVKEPLQKCPNCGGNLELVTV